MKVALYGNTANTFFALARAIRRLSDIDVHLFIDDNAEMCQRPDAEDASLREAMPAWIHVGPYHRMPARFWPGASPLVKALADFDVVVVSGGGVRYAPFVDAPFAFFTTGWDYTVSPFPLRYIARNPGVLRKLAHTLGGAWQRIGIRAVRELWTQPVACFDLAGERLAIPPERISPQYFPVPIDTNLYRPDPEGKRSRDPNVRRMVEGHDLVVFHPCSIEMNKGWRVETGQWRGSENLFEGYARFVERNPDARPVLVMIAKRAEGTEAAKRVFARRGVRDRVLWLEGPDEHGFPRRDLVPFYAAADVVAEDFGTGWFGATTIEGASMGKPVMCHVLDRAMKKMYPDGHPILSVQSPDEIASCLSTLLRDPEERRRRGEASRTWAVEHHAFDAVAARYIPALRALARSAD